MLVTVVVLVHVSALSVGTRRSVVRCNHEGASRREVFSAAAAAATTVPSAWGFEDNEMLVAQSVTYLVVPDSSPRLHPSLEPINGGRAIEYLSKGTRGVFLGEHHDASADHAVQAELIRSLSSRRQCCVGLEAVQQRFQPALDLYVDRKISATEMRRRVEWDSRWVWPFERYLPVFEACRATGTKLLALNVDSEDLAKVEVGGYANLERSALNRYVPDGQIFVQFANTTAFREYVRYVIEPSYNAHAQMGILRTTITGQLLDADMPFANFYSGRMLWDSSMANIAADYCRENPTHLFIGLVGADHVKFGCGVPARFALALDVPLPRVKSVLLNPSPFDTSPDIISTSVPPFTLQLRFAEVGAKNTADARQTASPQQSVLPLADLIWLGGVEDA
ncbi:hypothetical protein CTAYLR_001061 [Chrysophaeum taylorii]|uniref:Haem-binding uptake Tiki superfamily ChaN domain-containing protein n=1 Tax=Chrysophaeum taylorii TaxID=2483200 RepID=A0AAD7XJL9_9STRA|nr:hypothetical protein CTAYLR_001061 [Chrysophaeum taylorii]